MENIDNDTFKRIFMESADLIHKRAQNIHAFNVELLMNVFDDNIGDDMDKFIQMSKKTFSKILETYANIKKKYTSKLYTAVMNKIESDKDKKCLRDAFQESVSEIKRVASKAFNFDEIIHMFCNNIENIADITAFMHMDQQQFNNIITKYATPSLRSALFKEIRKRLHRTAQNQQLGRFVSTLNINEIESDYHHILQVHIYKGDRMSVTNVFKFFNKVIHYDECEKEIQDCRSFKRRNERFHKMNSLNNNEINDSAMNARTNVIAYEDKLQLNHYYVQSELDVIHSHLVHSEWKKIDKKYHATDKDSQDHKSKYISAYEGYGFGIVYEHHRLQPKHHSIYDELIHNKQCSMEASVFHNLLTKTSRKHAIALRDYKDQLISKYYSREYSILRNEEIGIRHILAIVIYTDISNLCTIFRKTYRKTNNTTLDDDSQSHHKEFYHFGRFLFEAVEFFGTEMKKDVHVFHGLDKEMNFDKFTAYFNQPISCTKSFASARNFSGDTGIILQLTSGSEYFDDASKIPKYLSVEWLSNFPNENEVFFYGSHVAFKIEDIYIIAESKWRSHKKQMNAFNKFQKLIQNERIEWKENEMKTLIPYIKHQIDEKYCKSTNVLRYSYSLFDHFCAQITWICIQNFIELQPLLNTILFSEFPISFVPLLKLFPNVTQIVLNEIDIDTMSSDKECDTYLLMIEECIEFCSGSGKIHYGQYLKRITFKSNLCHVNKENFSLATFQSKACDALKIYDWSVEYQLKIENMHSLTFINTQIEIADKIRAYEIQQEKDRHKFMELQQIQIEMQLDKMLRERKLYDKLQQKDTIIEQQHKLREQKKLELEKKKTELMKPQQNTACIKCDIYKTQISNLCKQILELEHKHEAHHIYDGFQAEKLQIDISSNETALNQLRPYSRSETLQRSKSCKIDLDPDRSKSNRKRRKRNRLKPTALTPYESSPTYRKPSSDTPVPKKIKRVKSDNYWMKTTTKKNNKKKHKHAATPSLQKLESVHLVASFRDLFDNTNIDESDEETQERGFEMMDADDEEFIQDD